MRRTARRKVLEEAAWLPGLFDGTRFDAPSYLYARKPEKPRNVMRSIETLEPMARTFDLGHRRPFRGE